MQKGQVLIFLLAGILILVVVGGAFYMGKQTTPKSLPTPVVTSQTPQSSSSASTILPNSTPAISDQELSKITKEQLNPSKTFAFYFKSDTPAFGPGQDENDPDMNDNPFKLCYNGDTRYRTPKYRAGEGTFTITPYILDINTKQERILSVIGETRAPNGCVKIIQWIDDNHLLQKECWGDITNGCSSNLIDVNKNVSHPY